VGPAWFSRRAVLLHLTALVVVAGCLALGWWQLNRALSGNTLSWAYAIEWPFFAGYGVYLWWRLVHEQPGELPVAPAGAAGDRPEADGRARDGPARYDEQDGDEEDEELAAYNRYLAELSASDERKSR
jgi:DNA-binding transcriptional regulator of glucitol operon